MATIPEHVLVPHGAGPVATVFLASPPTVDPPAALKVYPAAVDRHTLAQYADEQDRLATLRSVSSILLVDAIDELTDGRTALRTAFCPRSLSGLVAERGPLPMVEVVELGETLAAVLADAHQAGIVHGGVTPANVLFRPTGQPVLADFGLALRQRFPRDPADHAPYVAPEVLRDSDQSDASDLYGLGALLHLAMTGDSPFPARLGEPAGEVVLRVLREPPPIVAGEDVPAELPGLLSRLLAKDPADRPATAAEVAAEFRQMVVPVGPADAPTEEGPGFDDFRDELPAVRSTTAAPPPMPAKAPVVRRPRRPRGVSRGAVIAAAAVVSVVAVVPVLFRPGPEPTGSQPSVTPTSIPSPSAAPTSTPPAPPAVQLHLDPPRDQRTTVVLRWRSSKPLTFAVLAAEQGGKEPKPYFVRQGTTLTVPVSPTLKYCFVVQGTDGANDYESAPKAIRGATCQG